MRLEILNSGYRPGTKLLFAVIRLFSGQPVPDAARLVFYRPDFYGARAKKFTHEAMRGPSAWSVADRELMAAFVSTVMESAFCIGAHTGDRGAGVPGRREGSRGARRRGIDPLRGRLRATLRMLGKLTPEGQVSAEDTRTCCPQVSHASKSRTRWRSAPRSTPPAGSPTPSASRCSAPRASRQEPSTCSSAVTSSTAARLRRRDRAGDVIHDYRQVA